MIDERLGSVNSEWSPMAKAFQKLQLKYLNSLKLEHAMTLRNEGRLESLRVFLNISGKLHVPEILNGSENVQHLADELEVKVREAEEEWKQIDRRMF